MKSSLKLNSNSTCNNGTSGATGKLAGWVPAFGNTSATRSRYPEYESLTYSFVVNWYVFNKHRATTNGERTKDLEDKYNKSERMSLTELGRFLSDWTMTWSLVVQLRNKEANVTDIGNLQNCGELEMSTASRKASIRDSTPSRGWPSLGRLMCRRT
jgi:hypothetical protein